MTDTLDRTRRLFAIEDATDILARTPSTINALLRGLPASWTLAHEGGETWSPFDVIGHLIHGERTDWVPRARVILEHGEARPFATFDRFAQFENSKGKSMTQLLDEFARLRAENLDTLRSWSLSEDQLDLEGMHPELGLVTLRQLLSTWVVHDLTHIRQIVTVMAKRAVDAALS